MPKTKSEELTKVTLKIPTELDDAIELTAHQWRMKKREAVTVILEDGLKRAHSTRSHFTGELCE